MITASKPTVHILSNIQAFGPSKQSFEIKNTSKKEVTVFLERTGSEYFQIADSRERISLAPGTAARVYIELRLPKGGFVISLQTTYKAVIKVWLLEPAKGVKRKLVGSFEVTGTGPGFVAPENLHCFRSIGSEKKEFKETRVK